VGIGNQYGIDMRSGRKEYGGLWTGSHTVFALAKEGAETKQLAWEAALMLQRFGQLIAERFRLHRFEVARVGATAALKEATETYVVPVVLAYMTESLWSLQEDAPRLKRVAVTANELT
jgi:hypothetical protein